MAEEKKKKSKEQRLADVKDALAKVEENITKATAKLNELKLKKLALIEKEEKIKKEKE